MNILLNIKREIILIVLSLFFISCLSAEDEYQKLSKEINDAIVAHDGNKIESISEKIDHDYITDNDLGLEYLKLKLLALTLIDKYEEADKLIDKYLKVYQNNFKLYIAKGLITKRNGMPAQKYFQVSLGLLRQMSDDLKDENTMIIGYYLSLLTDESHSDYVMNEIIPSLSDEGLEIVEMFKQMNKEELLLNPPIWFYSNYSISLNSDEVGDKWWE